MDRHALTPLVGALLTAVVWTAPLPLTRLALATDPLLVTVLGVPAVLSLVVALAVWRYGWSRGAMFGGLVGATAYVVLSLVSALVDTPRDITLNQLVFGTTYVAIATSLAWLLGGVVGRRLRQHFVSRTIAPSAARQHT